MKRLLLALATAACALVAFAAPAQAHYVPITNTWWSCWGVPLYTTTPYSPGYVLVCTDSVWGKYWFMVHVH